MSIVLSKEEEERRIFILDGDIWKVLIYISLPLILYNIINQFFSVFDILIASRMSSSIASTVSFVSQIQSMLSAVGSGLAIGGGIIIARFYGAGDMDNVNKYINTLVFISFIIGIIILVLVIPFSVPFLRFLKMPEDLLATGSIYFILEISMLVCIFINTIYFSIEKAKGNTKVILFYNILVLTIKLFLTLFFVYVLNKHILMLSLASFISHIIITIIALINMSSKKNPFKLSFKYIDFSIKTLKPIFVLSFPIFFEKFSFSLGKVIVNSMSALYGSIVVGALGVSNRVSGISTSPTIGVEDAEASTISQALGSNNIKRALGIFKRSLILNLSIAIFFFIIMTVFKNPIILLFAKGDLVFAQEISKIYNYERYATILLAISSSVMGLLYGFGYTKISMILNMIRLFLFRIPPLWIIQNFTSIGSEGVGMAMLISNGLVGISAGVVSFFLIKKIVLQKHATVLT